MGGSEREGERESWKFICISEYSCCISGDYIGFDENEPTSQSGGKTKVVEQLKKKHEMYVYNSSHQTVYFQYKIWSSPNSIVMIGDGATDLEASPPAVSVYKL